MKKDNLEASHVNQGTRHTLHLRRVSAVCILVAINEEYILSWNFAPSLWVAHQVPPWSRPAYS